MIADREENQLIVSLIEPQESKHSGHKLRSAVNSNPAWYSRFCNDHLHSRSKSHIRKRTIIKRQDTLKLLKNLLVDINHPSKYSQELLAKAENLGSYIRNSVVPF